MKRVLCILSSLDAGGAETFMMKLLRNMDKTRYMMDFCVGSDKEGFYEKEALSLGAKVYRVTLKTKNPIKFTTELRYLLKQNNYDAVLRLGDTFLTAFDLWVAKSAGVKRLAMRSCNAYGSGSNTFQILHKLLRKPVTSIANVKFAPSTEAAEYTFGKDIIKSGKASLLNNAVDLSVYKYDDLARNKIRKELGIVDDHIYGHIGRFSHQKNHDFLIDVFYEIAKIDDKAKLLLLGKGELIENVKKKVNFLGLSEKTIFAGVRSDVPDVLSAMDVFLLPSFYEGLPNTVIEAQATGLPCFVSDTVTREANITSLVEYLPLEKPAVWAQKCIDTVEKMRITDTEEAFILRRYDIDTITREFEYLIFDSEC